jgi:serine/threonine-protein kinase
MDTVLQRPIAIKMTKAGFVPNSEAAARFHAEARIAAGVSHPNVVTIYDFGVMGSGIPYLIMELLSGMDLRTRLKVHGALCERTVLDIVRQVAAAVDAAHSRNVLHRDLKPENIYLIDAQGGVCAKVLDFGIARALETGTSLTATITSGIVGTPAYMAPEQLGGGPPTRAWDIWALAVVTFEMVTGVHPFGRSAANAADRAVALEANGIDLSAGWKMVFTRALCAENRNRPQNVRDFLQLLDTIAA